MRRRAFVFTAAAAAAGAVFGVPFVDKVRRRPIRFKFEHGHLKVFCDGHSVGEVYDAMKEFVR